MRLQRTWVLDARICWVVLLAFSLLSLVPTNGMASLAESRLSTGETLSQREAHISKIRTALETEIVSQRLADYGLSKDEISAKLPTMSDEQLHQLAGLSDSLAEGGVLGLVIGVLLVILLVVVILKITDKRIIVR
jgi:hypothetical protein